MSLGQAIFLGLLQGLTEFLPVSSSAHLLVAPALLGWEEPGLAFDAALHLGTLIAVVVYFRRELLALALALPRAIRRPGAVLRSPKLHDIPDPLRSSLRNLMAVAGGRTVMVPAVIGFGRQADGRIRADLTLVLADVRNGHVLWRSVPGGTGATPREALDSALTVALPVDVGGP